MQTISINLIVPERWSDLSDKQLRYVFQLIADEFNSDEIKVLCLLQRSESDSVRNLNYKETTSRGSLVSWEEEI